MDKMQETATEYGMTINIKKTKVITMYNQQETWWGVCGLAWRLTVKPTYTFQLSWKFNDKGRAQLLQEGH